MQFLSDVYLRCPDCDGRRYRPEVLEVKLSPALFPPKSIADVLDLPCPERSSFSPRMRSLPAIGASGEVGLDYLRLGQPVPTLSRR